MARALFYGRRLSKQEPFPTTNTITTTSKKTVVASGVNWLIILYVCMSLCRCSALALWDVSPCTVALVSAVVWTHYCKSSHPWTHWESLASITCNCVSCYDCYRSWRLNRHCCSGCSSLRSHFSHFYCTFALVALHPLFAKTQYTESGT